MKTHLLLLGSLLLAATFTPPALAVDIDTELALRSTGHSYIERGMTRETVQEMLGAPSGRLGSDVWVYLDFKAVNPIATGKQQNAALAEKQDALVVAFKDDRVSLIRACPSKPVVAFLARQEKSKTAAPAIAAK